MPFHIRNTDTDALARRLAAARGVGLTEAVHAALENELARVNAEPSAVELGIDFARKLRARGDPQLRKPADRDFIDSLYGDE